MPALVERRPVGASGTFCFARVVASVLALIAISGCALSAQSRPEPIPKPGDQAGDNQEVRRDTALEAISTEIRLIREQAARIEQAHAKRDAEPGPPIYSNWFLIVVTAGAVMAAFSTLREIRKQAESAKTSADAAKASAETAAQAFALTHRPRVRVKNFVVKNMPAGTADATTLGLAAGSFRALNVGDQPALIVGSFATWVFGDLKMENPAVNAGANDRTQNGRILGPGQVITVDLPIQPLTSLDETRAFKPDETGNRLFVVGVVKYWDMIGDKRGDVLRRTFFGRILRNGRMVPVEDTDYEYEE
jgi:hypothetical protein